MARSTWCLSGVVLFAIAGGCSASPSSTGGFGGDGNGAPLTTTSSASSGTATSIAVGVTSASSTSSGTVVCNAPPDMDMDGDGWTGADGDCNDCDPNVNPGAIDVGNNEDCDPSTGPATPCDAGLFLDDTDPMSAAKAIELCQTAQAGDKKWGVLSASYTGADGSAKTAGTQVGLMQLFGTNVKAQAGSNMLVLSSGNARTPGQPSACNNYTCTHSNGTPPPGFPQDVPNCSGATEIHDDIALDLKIRAPMNATGYKLDFKFYSFEYPSFVCTAFNDQFIALVNPAPMGSIKGNIAFDNNKNPVSVNIGFFDVCNSNDGTRFAECCGNSQCNTGSQSCPSTPSPYCPSGASDLTGTGYDVWGNYNMMNDPISAEAAGATSWLETSAPVGGGQEFDLRLAIWDTGDDELDSTVLVDNFQWIANGGTVTVGTTPESNPK